MRKIVLTLPALILAGGAAFAQEHGGKIDWVRDPAVGFLKSKIEGRAAMLYFTATW